MKFSCLSSLFLCPVHIANSLQLNSYLACDRREALRRGGCGQGGFGHLYRRRLPSTVLCVGGLGANIFIARQLYIAV